MRWVSKLELGTLRSDVVRRCRGEASRNRRHMYTLYDTGQRRADATQRCRQMHRDKCTEVGQESSHARITQPRT